MARSRLAFATCFLARLWVCEASRSSSSATRSVDKLVSVLCKTVRSMSELAFVSSPVPCLDPGLVRGCCCCCCSVAGNGNDNPPPSRTGEAAGERLERGDPYAGGRAPSGGGGSGGGRSSAEWRSFEGLPVESFVKEFEIRLSMAGMWNGGKRERTRCPGRLGRYERRWGACRGSEVSEQAPLCRPECAMTAEWPGRALSTLDEALPRLFLRTEKKKDESTPARLFGGAGGRKQGCIRSPVLASITGAVVS